MRKWASVSVVGFAIVYLFGAGLRAGADFLAVGAAHGAGGGAPEQVRRRGDEALRGKGVGDIAQIVDAMDGRRQHDRGHSLIAGRQREIAIERLAVA